MSNSVQVGLIGSSIQASRTPALHTEEARHHGLDLTYRLLDLDQVPEGPAALERVLLEAESSGYAGVNVTHPCKQAVMKYLHELSEDVKALGAVNTVVFRDGRRIGHNTDWTGFAESFRRGLSSVRSETATLLGAGGGGSAVAYAVLKMGTARLYVFDIDHAKAVQLAALLALTFDAHRIKVVTEVNQALAESDGLINATPMGMNKYPGLPLPAELLRPELWVADIVYFPLETALLKAARERGCRTLDGGGMAVFQAVEAFRLFTGIKPDARRMSEFFRRLVQSSVQ